MIIVVLIRIELASF